MDDTLILIQARLGSTRFPRKVLADLAGRPVLQWVVDRAAATGWPVRACVPVEDLAELAAAVSLPNDGSAWCAPAVADWDVLRRLAMSTLSPASGWCVRLTADSPFHDPAVIRDTVGAVQAAGIGYGGNCVPPPACADGGLDVEVLRLETLQWLNQRVPATDRRAREHPTMDLWSPSAGDWTLTGTSVALPPGYGTLGIRWMVDTPEDLTRLRRIAEQLPAWDMRWTSTRAADLASRTST